MPKIACLVVIAALMPAAADPVAPYSQAWGNNLADTMHRVSDEAEACVFATAPAKALPAEFGGSTKVKLGFAADGTPAQVVIVQASGNHALDRAEAECWRSAPHLKDIGLALLPEHEITAASDWKALLRKH